MLAPQINTGSVHHSALSLLLTLLMSDYDTCVFHKDNRSSDNDYFEDLMYSVLFHSEKSLITSHMTDPNSDHILLKINKNHLNIFLISYVDSEAISHLNRIYNQSNQFDVWNLILIPGPERVDRISEFIAEQSTIVASTTLAILSAQHDGHNIWIKDENNYAWTQLTTINNDSLGIRKDNMFDKHINHQGQELVVSFTTHPITNFLFRVCKQPLFIGIDAFIGVEIYQHINARPVYTSPLIESLRMLRKYEVIGTQNEVREEIEKQRRFTLHSVPYLSLIFDINKLDKVLINLDSVVSQEVDINMSPALVRNTNKMDFLYPHDRECIKLIVPRADPGYSFISQIFTSNEGFGFGISLITFWVIRLIVLHSPINKWPALLIDTCGFYMAQMSRTPQNLGEKLLLLAIMIFSIPISALLAGRVFILFMDNNTRKPIHSVGELLDTDLKILMLRDHFNTTLVENWISTVSPRLLNRTEFTDMNSFVDECAAQTSKYAFGLPENAASLINLIQQNSYNFYYILKENLCKLIDGGLTEMRSNRRSFIDCSRTSYHIKHNSPMTQKINEVIQGMLENGIVGVFYKWTRHAFMTHLSYEANTQLDINDSLRLWQINGALVIYGGGVLICILVLFIEKITYRVTLSISKRSTKVTHSQNVIHDDINEKNLTDDLSDPDEIDEVDCGERSFSIVSACGVDRKYFDHEKETTVSVDIEAGIAW